MAELVADYVLRRLKEWGVHRIYGYPGDGINAFLGALDRADGDPEFIQARHEEMAAFMACGHAKFTQEVGVCMATSGPGAIHLLNGLYDAKLDHVPVVAIVGQQKRMSLGAGYQQEVDLQVLFKDVSEYVQYCMEPGQARHLIDAAVRHALDRKGVATLIFPADVQEEKAVPSPPRMHGSVYSSVGYSRPRVVPQDVDLHRAAALLNDGEKVAMLVGQGARRRCRRGHGVRREARRRRGEGAARPQRSSGRPAVRHGADRPPRLAGELRADGGLRHAPDDRDELPLLGVATRGRPGEVRADRPRRAARRACAIRSTCRSSETRRRRCASCCRSSSTRRIAAGARRSRSRSPSGGGSSKTWRSWTPIP